ncbi:MAG: TlpA family protein disulfide reductase, partial [Blastocatellia bacterium]|nr:TlpA family protein disulfide reductase [Blastocatellia bacterium]
PTTLFIGRDGLVKKIHAGFDGPATGERHTRLKAEFEETVKELLKGGE